MALFSLWYLFFPVSVSELKLPGEMVIIQENSLIAPKTPPFIASIGPLASLYAEDEGLYLLIEELNQCENSGKWDRAKILDINNKYSYGGLQFQMETFLRYGKKYGILPKWMDEEIGEQIIYEREIQMAIAEKMLNDGLWRHWFNCFKKINSL